MSDLHFLFLHGEAVYRAALVVLPVAGALIPFRVRARRVARDASAAREGLPVPVPLSSARKPGDEICTEGVLAGPKGARAYGWAGQPAREAEGGLVLHTDEQAIALAGPVGIVVGGRESAVWRGSALARRLGLSIEPAARGKAQRALLLGPGDRVRVHGRLARVLDAQRYREARTTLAIEPLHGAAAIRVAAVRAPQLVAWPLRFWGLGLFAGLALWAVLFVGGGALALRGTEGALPIDEGTHLSAAALAAATPLRERALHALLDRLLVSARALTPERLARFDEVYSLLDDCDGQRWIRWRAGQIEEAAQKAEACGLPEDGDLLFALGRLADASRAYGLDAVPLHDAPARALHRAEAALVARDWARSAAAVTDYAAASGDDDADRQEALGCVADAIRARGGDGAARRSLWVHLGDRAMCRILAADLAPPAARRGVLGDLGFVWGDAQGMEFAKLLLNRTGQALLEEAGPGAGLSTDAYRYGLHPGAYLARNDRGPPPPFSRVNDMGNDVGHMEHYASTHLTDHPWALYLAMVRDGRGDARDPEDFRVHLVGHAALFLAAAGDVPGARALLPRLADVPDRPKAMPYWSRPNVWEIAANVDELDHEPPFHPHGLLLGALDAAIGRAHAPQADAAEVARSVERLRAVALDREIAVPLQMLEAFARR